MRKRVGSFYRAAIPEDIQSGNPSPDQWGEPVSTLLPAGCDPIKNFVNHSVIFGVYPLLHYYRKCVLINAIWYRYHVLW